MDFRQLVADRNPSLAVKLLRTGLRILSIPYYLGAQLKNGLYDLGLKGSFRSPLPTISVGNLSVGGTGKSPVVAWIARRLREQGVRVAILSRGYKQLDSGQNDEALELEQLLPDVPHLQHWDRSRSARLAVEELQMQCLLLDDAFQHRRMDRDLDIVLLDSTDPPSAQHVLPAGLYREPFRSLRRADVIILTRTDQARPSELSRLRNRVRKIARQPLILEACHRPHDLQLFPDQSQELSWLQDAPVLAFCGIGHPDAFFETLERLGARLVDRKKWPDHHAYHRQDIDTLHRWAMAYPEAQMIVCTMKDSVKLQTERIGHLPLAALSIELKLRPEDEQSLLDCLNQVLDGRREQDRSNEIRTDQERGAQADHPNLPRG